MTTSDPNDPDRIPPDEWTEEQALEQQIAQVKAEVYGMKHSDESIALNERLYHLNNRLYTVQEEAAAFLADYCPDAIGSDPEDKIERITPIIKEQDDEV